MTTSISIEQVRELLTIEKFQKWLESLPPEMGIGFPRNIRCCPVATYLQTSDIKASRTSVDKDEIEVWLGDGGAIAVFTNDSVLNESGSVPRVPGWLYHLIRRIDFLYPGSPQSISARKVLAILKEVKNEV